MGNRGTTAGGGRQAAADRMQADVKSVERLRGGGSNKSQVVELENGERGIFKPASGEAVDQREHVQGSLAMREVGAYGVDQALGWDLVPPTVMRKVGKNEGSLQRWVAGQEGADVLLQRVRAGTGNIGERRNYRVNQEALASVNRSDLLRLKAFDHIMGNEDRRFYNIIVTRGGRVKAIDNGLSMGQLKDTFYTSGLIPRHMRALGFRRDSDRLSASDVTSIRNIFGSPGTKITTADIARVRGIMGNPEGGRFGVSDVAIRGAIGRARDIISGNGSLRSFTMSPKSIQKLQAGKMQAPKMPR